MTVEYQIPTIFPNQENHTNTHVFHFNLFIPYFDEFFQIRNQFQSYSEMLLFLLSKYSERLHQISRKKKNCRKTYQPITHEYEKYSIRITDAAHELLFNYSNITGLSMSYLIRLLIEWERGDYSDERGRIDYTPVYEQDDSLVTTISEMHIHYHFSRARERVTKHVRTHFG